MSDHNEAYWKEVFEDSDALWIHGGVPTKPHALLASGKHSGGYFNATNVIQDPRICEEAVTSLLHQLDFRQIHKTQAAWGSAMGAITLAHEVGRQLNTSFGYTEKDGDAMKVGRFSTYDGERILMVEDVMTTGGTTKKSIAALEECGGVILPYLLVLVNRSGMAELDGRKIISLVDRELPIWTPEECPLCQGGSEAVKPKNDWAELVA